MDIQITQYKSGEID